MTQDHSIKPQNPQFSALGLFVFAESLRRTALVRFLCVFSS